jgi:hypothetical protein
MTAIASIPIESLASSVGLVICILSSLRFSSRKIVRDFLVVAIDVNDEEVRAVCIPVCFLVPVRGQVRLLATQQEGAGRANSMPLHVVMLLFRTQVTAGLLSNCNINAA